MGSEEKNGVASKHLTFVPSNSSAATQFPLGRLINSILAALGLPTALVWAPVRNRSSLFFEQDSKNCRFRISDFGFWILDFGFIRAAS
jgi:hypothetical protein